MNALTLKISLAGRQARLFDGLACLSGMNRRQFAKFGLVTFLQSDTASNIFDSVVNGEDNRTLKAATEKKATRKESRP